MAQSSLQDWRKEADRVEREIWMHIEPLLERHLRPLIVDIGVGNSTSKYAEKGYMVVGIDIDEEKLQANHNLLHRPQIVLVEATATHLPLRRRRETLTAYHFTLHEIPAEEHNKTITEAARIADKIIIVEPEPKGSPAYNLYASLMRRAMEAIGKHEVYREEKYWINLLIRNNIKPATLTKVEWRHPMPLEELRRKIAETRQIWTKEGVPEPIIEDLHKIIEEAKKTTFKYSDIMILIAEVNHDNPYTPRQPA